MEDFCGTSYVHERTDKSFITLYFSIDMIYTQELAAEVLEIVENTKLSEKEAMKKCLKGKIKDYKIWGSVHAYVFEVLKRKNLIDLIIQKSSGINPRVINPFLRNLLRVAVYEIFFKNVHPALATDSAVRIAKKINEKAAAFVNAVLRKAENVRIEKELEKIRKTNRRRYLSLKYFHPEWFIKLAEKVVDNVEDLLIANLKQTVYVRANTLRKSPENVRRYLEKNGVIVEGTILPEVFKVLSYEKPLTTLDGHDKDFVIQDLASCLVSYALSPENDEVIVDLAAAPGSKTSHLAALMENRGKIIAVDNSKERINRMKARLKRLGVKNVKVYLADGVKFRAEADKVLVDAPCSSTGALRNYPSIKWRFSYELFRKTILLQRKMLRNAARIGEIVVYSTCSITFDENEGNLLKLLDVFKVEDTNLNFGDIGIRKYRNKIFPHADRVVRLYPHIHDTAGFFISKLKSKI